MVASNPSSIYPASRPGLDHRPGIVAVVIFFGLLMLGLIFGAYNLYADVTNNGDISQIWLSFILLGIALLIALGFEFVNGFHDIANAVATVIYTHSLLPVKFILQVGFSAGFAMIFALLIAAILWNLATWWLGLPVSSLHTLTGSIIGVGIANALMHGRDGTSGVDWSQAINVGYSLCCSLCALFLLLALCALVKNQTLYREPRGNKLLLGGFVAC